VEPEEVSSFEQITESVGCNVASLNGVEVDVSLAEAVRPSVASFQFLGRPKFSQQQRRLCIVILCRSNSTKAIMWASSRFSCWLVDMGHPHWHCVEAPTYKHVS
jgi:hypothetical protein